MEGALGMSSGRCGAVKGIGTSDVFVGLPGALASWPVGFLVHTIMKCDELRPGRGAAKRETRTWMDLCEVSGRFCRGG